MNLTRDFRRQQNSRGRDAHQTLINLAERFLRVIPVPKVRIRLNSQICRGRIVGSSPKMQLGGHSFIDS